MPSRAEHNWNAAFAEEIIGPQHIVTALHLMIDVLDAGLRGTHKRDGVMDRIDAHQRDIADAVADARVAPLGPEPFIASGIGGIQSNVAEAGDSGIAAGKIAAAASFGPRHEFDVVAGRIAKADEGSHLALLGLTC